MIYSKLMDKTQELLTRGVDKIYPSKDELEKILRSGRKLKVYQGFDPTSPQLHIGHMVGLRKLRQWQDLGHTVIFLIGDFTGTIGDPSGRESTRIPLTHEEVLKNAQTYKDQAGKILRFTKDNPVQLMFNSEWLNKINGFELLKLAENFTQNQLVERDMFEKRIKKGKPIPISEFLYPIMQAYDSVAMVVDIEVGGTDQTFNMLMGRHLVRALQKREKFVMTTPLLTDSQGQKIGKTEGNAIALTDKPSDLFGKIMSLSDDVIVKGMEYLTYLPLDKISEVEKNIKGGGNPMPYKKMLAFEIVKQLHDHDIAHDAQKEFEKTVQNKDLPTEVYDDKGKTIIDVVQNKLNMSRSEAKRLLEQGGVSLNDEKIDMTQADTKIEHGMRIKVPRKVIKIK